MAAWRITSKRNKGSGYTTLETMNYFPKHVATVESTNSVNPSKKRPKVFKTGKDRISSLPNRVLRNILLFLPTKYAVGTCILSTRWKDLWASLPILDFDDDLLLCNDGDSAREMGENFASFVDRVLLLHYEFKIKSFRLKCGQRCNYSSVRRWIRDVLCRNVQELDLCISLKDTKVLPCGLFNCGTLASLKLCTHFVLKLPQSAALPSLKTLHLRSVEFLDDDSLRNLISGCNMLQDLVILKCGLKNINVLEISAPALKSLIINCASMGEYSTEFCNYEIVIDVPSLVYLQLADYIAEGYSMKNTYSRLSAHIHLYINGVKRKHAYVRNVHGLISGISNVESLELSGGSMEALKLCRYEIPTLHGVTELTVNVNRNIGWTFLPKLLHCCPKLEYLSLKEGRARHEEGVFWWQPPVSVPHCLLHCLKEIGIHSFRGQENELKVVQYLLKNAKHLLRLTVDTELTLREEFNLSKRLLMCTRGSVACEVEFL